ncbi:glycosyltransferase family 39 protein [Sanyastnella coralliicola]|uniref:glycosyltransferase family 39 protein n=1 Tax=Sanyastnella coralliicola TaxID=3069118 RepID=UPI0027BA396E|nr:glycosyltransferase family 39 protein [Longitalea sp. SCSIO 12813]
MNTLRSMWNNEPLKLVMLVAIALRLLATFFSPGYLMHDDHFLVVEQAASWADGEDADRWLPTSQRENPQPHPANFAYVGTQYVIFKALKAVGMEDPEFMMIFIRLFHAIYSLLIVYFGFKIAETISNKRSAAMVGLLLAALAFMPNFSVRQLVEFICIPPLMWSSWVLIKRQGDYRWFDFAIAGIGIGIATGFRFQCGVFGLGVGLALLLQKEWKGLFILGFSSLFFFAVAQIQDVFIWGEPFTQLRAYIEYNNANSGNYPNGPWYMYLLTVAGFLIPPVSLFLLFGFGYIGRKHLLLFVPAVAFFIFHSYFPNKQERFIFPFIPYLVILGVIGWNVWLERSSFWAKRQKLLKGMWSFFWVINIAGLLVLTFTYGKRSRVESMDYMYEQGDEQNFLQVFAASRALPPLYYQGDWTANYWYQPGETDLEQQRQFMCEKRDVRPVPNYVLFYGTMEEIQKQLTVFSDRYPTLTYDTTIEPGNFDKLLHWLNPINSVEYVQIYTVDPEDICKD